MRFLAWTMLVLGGVEIFLTTYLAGAKHPKAGKYDGTDVIRAIVSMTCMLILCGRVLQWW